MNDIRTPVPSIDTLKQQAKRLKIELSKDGTSVTHSKSLEILAHQYGFKDWNCLNASTQTNSFVSSLRVGQTIDGTYLGKHFVGEIIGLQKLPTDGRYRLSLELNAPIDVVSFESFSSWRKRIYCNVDEGGISKEKTSNGNPHMVLGAPK